MTVAEGQQAAARAALQAISNLRATLGTLDRVRRIVQVTVYIAAVPGFLEHPEVANGASELFVGVFGEAGTHARAAVGMSSLPRGASVEVDRDRRGRARPEEPRSGRATLTPRGGSEWTNAGPGSDAVAARPMCDVGVCARARGGRRDVAVVVTGGLVVVADDGPGPRLGRDPARPHAAASSLAPSPRAGPARRPDAPGGRIAA